MWKKAMRAGAAMLVVTALLLAAMAGTAAAEAKNIILMISDGMGYNTLAATDFYVNSKAVFESFPVKYGVSTYEVEKTASGDPIVKGYDAGQAWTNYNYVKQDATDSASAATAIATGVKTYNGYINVDITKDPLVNIAQIAAVAGKSTGVVTSVQFSHATPAGMVAHNVSRNNYSEIANEMIKHSNLDVIMGAGHPFYTDNGALRATPNYTYVGGEATWNALKAGDYYGWTLIDTKASFEALQTGDTPNKVIGVAQVATTLQQSRASSGKDLLPGTDPYNANVPTLEVMTRGALNVLDNDQDGFFLMIEGGAVDWANHANDITRMIEEQLDFNNSVQAVVDWVNAYSNWNETLLIVTADHECGFLWGPNSKDLGLFTALVNNGEGNLPGYQYGSGDHTNSLVPLFAIGAGSELFHLYADEYDSMRGWYLDNTEIFMVMNAQIVHTPIPGSVLLMGSGLVGMGLLRWRKAA